MVGASQMTGLKRAIFAGISLIVCALFVCALLTVIAPAARATDERVDTLRERLHLLDGYLEHFANVHYNYYPRAANVCEGGIRAAVWPDNPWTGSPMEPGYDPGDYIYTLSADRLSYTLVGYYPGGSITLHGEVPHNRKMQNDHRTIEGAELVQRFIEQWASSHAGVAPDPSLVDAEAAVGLQPGVGWWPHNPWTHEQMKQGTGWSEFTYKVDRGTGRYTLTVYFSRGYTRTYRGPHNWDGPVLDPFRYPWLARTPLDPS